MSAGIILQNNVSTINDTLQFLLETPEYKGRLSDRDISFLKGLGSVVTGTIAVKDVVDDIRSGMSIPRAVVVNLAAQGTNLFVTRVGTGGAIILMATPTPATILGGLAFYGLSQVAAGNMSYQAKAAAGYLYDRYADRYVDAVCSLANTQNSATGSGALMFTTSTGAASAEQAAEFVKQLPSQSGISTVKVRTLTDEGTYIIQKGDTLFAIAKWANRDMYELAAENSIEIIRRQDGSLFAAVQPGKVMVINASTSIKFITKYESDSIRAMYGDDAFDAPGLSYVSTSIYNDWKRSQLINSINIFTQPAIPQLAPLSLLSPEMQASIDGLRSSMSDMGLTGSMQLSALPSLGATSSLSYDLGAAASESMSWQHPLNDINLASYDSRKVDLAIEDYNEGLITGYSTGIFDSIGSAVDSFWNGFSFDTAIGTVQVGGSTGGGAGAPLGYNPPLYMGPSTGCPIGIDLGNDSQALAKDALGLKSMFSSTAFFNMDGDTYKERTGWVGPDDGLLVIDLGADGVAGGDGVRSLPARGAC